MRKKRKAFVREYTVDFNATQAAIRAGYSARSAYNQGNRLLKNPEVQAAIVKRIKELTLSADEVLIRLSKMATGAVATKVVKAKGETIQTYDVIKALEDIGRAHALFIDRQIFDIDGLDIIDEDE